MARLFLAKRGRPAPAAGKPRWMGAAAGAAGLLAIYLAGAYAILPLFWRLREPSAVAPGGAWPTVTRNHDGVAGDPLNVALVGSDEDVVRAMLAAGWRPADPVTLESSLRIAESVLFERPYPSAPMSDLFLFGRRQDLAFERQAGSSADQRHHVRWWRSPQPGADDRPLWLGSATFDIGVGISHLTGQITHHIDGDVDAERDRLLDDLDAAHQIERRYQAPGVGQTTDGRNAAGDRYHTDGRLTVGVLVAVAGRSSAAPPTPGREVR